MMEQMGEVLINTDFFTGQEPLQDSLYENLFEYVKTVKSKEYDGYIAKQRQWPVLYHLSPLRGNIVSSLDIQNTDTVLEIGSSCGEVTGRLLEMAKEVTCLDSSYIASKINAQRYCEKTGLQIVVGMANAAESVLDKYDVVTLIDVIGKAEQYIESDTPQEDLIQFAMEHLKPGGRLIIAVENRLGMRYFSGGKGSGMENYFEGIQGFADGRKRTSYTKEELLSMVKDCNGKEVRFMYPYPDHRFPIAIYSDEYLPKEGELTMNLFEMEQNRQVLFDEAKAYDSLVSSSLYPVFANSYLVEITV